MAQQPFSSQTRGLKHRSLQGAPSPILAGRDRQGDRPRSVVLYVITRDSAGRRRSDDRERATPGLDL